MVPPFLSLVLPGEGKAAPIQSLLSLTLQQVFVCYSHHKLLLSQDARHTEQHLVGIVQAVKGAAHSPPLVAAHWLLCRPGHRGGWLDGGG